jgi:ubiquinone/menaquinone biosynthesis C-methylase UbiE
MEMKQEFEGDQKRNDEQEHWAKHFEGYDLFQEAYSKYRAMMEFHVDALKDSKRVLDSGAGTGNLTRRLLESGHDVAAIDANENALQYLRDKCKNIDTAGNLIVQQADLSQPLPFLNEAFDGIASSLVIPFVPNYMHYFSENYRVLKSGGVFTLSTAIPKEGSMDALMQDIETEATKRGILPEHEEAFKRMWETSRQNERTVLEKGVSIEALVTALEEVGFVDIEKPEEQPYGEYVVFMIARKA